MPAAKTERRERWRSARDACGDVRRILLRTQLNGECYAQLMLNRSFRRIYAVAVSVVLCSSVALAQPRPAAPGSRRYPLPTEPRVYDTFQQKIKVTVVAHGIQRPWSLLPLPDGDFLVGVRPTGQVLAIRKGVLDPKPLTGLPAMHTTRTTGMLDMAMHPKFAE